MALVAFVMPLWRLDAGRFEYPDGSRGREIVDEARAQLEVRDLKRSLAERAGCPIDWKDEGKVHLSSWLDRRGWNGLRALAAHQDHPPRGLFGAKRFHLDEQPELHPGIDKILSGARSRYPHIVLQGDRSAILLPLDMPTIVTLGDGRTYGSARAFAADLRMLAKPLDIDPARWEQVEMSQDAMGTLRGAWIFLYKATRFSAQHKLPLIVVERGR